MTTLNASSFIRTGETLVKLSRSSQQVQLFAKSIPSDDPLKAEIDMFNQAIATFVNTFEAELSDNLLGELANICALSMQLELNVNQRLIKH